MSAKKPTIHNADIEVANRPWKDEDKKAFSEFLKARKKSIYGKKRKLSKKIKKGKT